MICSRVSLPDLAVPSLLLNHIHLPTRLPLALTWGLPGWLLYEATQVLVCSFGLILKLLNLS